MKMSLMGGAITREFSIGAAETHGCVGNGARAVSRSAKVGAFAKKNWIAASMEDRAMPVEDAATKMRGISEVGYDGTRSSAEVGASVREKWSLTMAASRTSFVSAKGRATWRNELARFCRISPIVAKPPPLLAAIFPWDQEGACSEKAMRTAGCGGETETVEESVGFRVAGHSDSHSGLWSYDGCGLEVTQAAAPPEITWTW
ncbi:hypothetical protein PIB30_015266 [Stylosanthes scabra]|uniref:Uncharacterized protein n=1 Tax=Stylosanthes scabra TaxID=79078 RepID=A0ABU6Y567_9FABA|nr:hypothetical protein [Stylosanthes scabra]